MLFSKIHPFYFFLSFAVGIFFCYIVNPKPEVIVKFPTPYNANKVVYKNKSNNCYKIQATKESCPLDKNLIKSQPILE